MLQTTLPVRAVSTILPGAPSCAVSEMRSEARLRSQTPTFDLSFAASQRSKRYASWHTLSCKDSPGNSQVTCQSVCRSSTRLQHHHIITFWHRSSKQGLAMAACRSVEHVDEPKWGGAMESGRCWICARETAPLSASCRQRGRVSMVKNNNNNNKKHTHKKNMLDFRNFRKNGDVQHSYNKT